MENPEELENFEQQDAPISSEIGSELTSSANGLDQVADSTPSSINLFLD
jgi:hypothetical protein